MASVTTADVRACRSARQEEGAADATVNREVAILKRAFRLAVDDGKLLHRPRIKMLAENNVRQGFFERTEFEDVRKALPTELRGLVTFAYLTGWRVPSEVLTLEWSQVDLEARKVRLEPGTTKNKDGRTFDYALLPKLEDVIAQQWGSHIELVKAGVICPYVVHRAGQPVRDLRMAWHSACRQA